MIQQNRKELREKVEEILNKILPKPDEMVCEVCGKITTVKPSMKNSFSSSNRPVRIILQSGEELITCIACSYQYDKDGNELTFIQKE